MIASVHFRNFKALRSAQLRLAPMNLLIGPNGSGKTSLIQALLRLRSLAKLSPAAPGLSPEASAVSSRTRDAGPEIIFNFTPPFAEISARLACVSELVCNSIEISPADAPGWPALRAEVAGIRSYVFDHQAMTGPVPQSDGGELAPHGSNLAAVLLGLQARAPAAFAALRAELRRIMPEFADLALAVRPDETVELGLQLDQAGGGHRVAAEDLSQGTLYLLAVLALSFDPAPPSVICLEEIDRGIHPRMLREVRDALYRLAYPETSGASLRPVQVIVTTHSPYFLDLFRDHPEEIVISEKRGQEAYFTRLADRTDLAELLKEGSLGDIWFSGVLGGVPEE